MRLATPLAEDLPALLARLPVTALIAAAQDVQLTDDEAEPPAPEEPAANGSVSSASSPDLGDDAG
jgi:hypothetical protein